MNHAYITALLNIPDRYIALVQRLPAIVNFFILPDGQNEREMVMGRKSWLFAGITDGERA